MLSLQSRQSVQPCLCWSWNVSLQSWHVATQVWYVGGGNWHTWSICRNHHCWWMGDHYQSWVHLEFRKYWAIIRQLLSRWLQPWSTQFGWQDNVPIRWWAGSYGPLKTASITNQGSRLSSDMCKGSGAGSGPVAWHGLHGFTVSLAILSIPGNQTF